ncbi:MAG: 7-cyano-7-deazaguanine synthase QueC [bacterium]
MTAPPVPPGPPAATVLLSGGLDSATVLAMARAQGFVCHCLSFDYGQRHKHELLAARALASALSAASWQIVTLDLRAFGGSALTDDTIAVPKDRDERAMAADIPVTYVPARNLVLLSMAVAFAESRNCVDVFTGVNAVDYSGYPDCRPQFIRSFAHTATLATALGTQGRAFTVHAPLSDMTKAQIIRAGAALSVPYHLTHSCYDPATASDGSPLACGRCDACQIRRRGFAEAGIPDPTRYL